MPRLQKQIHSFEKKTDQLKEQIHGLSEGREFGVVFAALLEVTHEALHLAIEEGVDGADQIHEEWMYFVHEVAEILK